MRSDRVRKKGLADQKRCSLAPHDLRKRRDQGAVTIGMDNQGLVSVRCRGLLSTGNLRFGQLDHLRVDQQRDL